MRLRVAISHVVDDQLAQDPQDRRSKGQAGESPGFGCSNNLVEYLWHEKPRRPLLPCGLKYAIRLEDEQPSMVHHPEDSGSLHEPRDYMFIFPGGIKARTANRSLYHFPDNPTVYRYRMSPFVAFMASHPTSLLYLAIVILSCATQYTLGLHLIDICNTIWLIFFTAFPASRRPSPDTTVEVSASPQTISPPPSTGTPPLLLTPHPSLLEVEVQGANLSYSIIGCEIRSWILDLDSFLDLSYEESSQGAISNYPYPSALSYHST